MRKSCLLKFLFVFFIAINSAIFVLPQEKSVATEITDPVVFDQFGDISEKEFAPRLLKYLDAFRENLKVEGVIIFYRCFNDSLFRQTVYFHDRKIDIYSRYIVGSGRSVTIVNGGYGEKMTTELWLIPLDSKFPEITNSSYKPPFDSGLVRLELISTEELDFKEAKIKKDEEENEEVEEVEEGEENADGDEPLLPSRDPICLTGWSRKTNKFHGELADVLSKDLTWRSVLIFYADGAEFDIKILRENIESLINSKKIDMKRVKIVYGGYREYPQIESWIVPKNGIEPEAMPDEKLDEN